MKAAMTANLEMTAGLSTRTGFHDIETALNQLVAMAAGSLPVAWEGLRFEPVLGTTFLQVFHEPAMTFAGSLGYSGYTVHRGLTQINITVPADRGKSAALFIADRFSSTLRRGVDSTFNGVSVRISAVSLGTWSVSKAWAILPVTVTWQCYKPD